MGILVSPAIDVLLIHDCICLGFDTASDRRLLEQQTRSQPSVALHLHRRVVPRGRIEEDVRPEHRGSHAIAKSLRKTGREVEARPPSWCSRAAAVEVARTETVFDDEVGDLEGQKRITACR